MTNHMIYFYTINCLVSSLIIPSITKQSPHHPSRGPARGGDTELPVSKRCEDINAYHTLAVYKYTCRGLFEAHKLLFSLQMCIKIMETQGTINQEEFNFFSFGAGMVDRTQQRPNNADWMPPVVWDNLTEMDKIPGFQVNNFFDLVPLLSHLLLSSP